MITRHSLLEDTGVLIRTKRQRMGLRSIALTRLGTNSIQGTLYEHGRMRGTGDD